MGFPPISWKAHKSKRREMPFQTTNSKNASIPGFLVNPAPRPAHSTRSRPPWSRHAPASCPRSSPAPPSPGTEPGSRPDHAPGTGPCPRRTERARAPPASLGRAQAPSAAVVAPCPRGPEVARAEFPAELPMAETAQAGAAPDALTARCTATEALAARAQEGAALRPV